MSVRAQCDGINPLALAQLRQPALGIVGLAAGLLVDGLNVGLQEARESDRAAAGGKGRLPAVCGGSPAGCRRPSDSGNPEAQGGAPGVGHLGRDGALPDQLVEPVAVGVELGMQRTGGSEGVPGRTDGLVCLLRVLDLAGVLPRRGMQILLAVQLTGLIARRVDRRLRQCRRVGSHVGDVAVLVEPLGDAHRALGREAQLSTRLLLQRRRHERRVGPAGVRLLLHRCHGQRGTPKSAGERGRGGLVEHHHVIGLAQGAQGIEVAAGGHPLAGDGDQPGVEPRRAGIRVGDAGVQFGQHVPVPGTAEGHPFPFALHDDARRDGLHPAGRKPRSDFLPEHRADFVTVEAVENAPRLLRVDQVGVQVTGVLRGRPDGRLRDLVEHHPANRNPRLEGLQQMPGDRFAFTVAVGGQIEFVDALEQVFQLRDGGLFVRADDVERLKLRIDVDPESGPLLRLVFGRHIGRALGEVPDVASGRFHDVVGSQIAGNFSCLGGRLDNDEPPDGARVTGTVACQLRLRSALPARMCCPHTPGYVSPHPA